MSEEVGSEPVKDLTIVVSRGGKKEWRKFWEKYTEKRKVLGTFFKVSKNYKISYNFVYKIHNFNGEKTKTYGKTL